MRRLAAEFMLHGFVEGLLFDSFGVFLLKRLKAPLPSPSSASSQRGRTSSVFF